jgi:hypothetical protein
MPLSFSIRSRKNAAAGDNDDMCFFRDLTEDSEFIFQARFLNAPSGVLSLVVR